MTLLTGTCQLMTFFVGISQVCFMPAPVGDCKGLLIKCCPHNNTVDIQYLLFTRSNPNKPEIINPSDSSSLSRTLLNRSRPIVIYLFGFTEAVTGPSTTTLKNAFLKRGDYNFISVNWSRLVVFPWYISAVRNAKYMGQQLANFIEFLNNNGIPAGSLHVIGFSLGAEAAGFAGKTLNRRGLRIGRITGLDPAYPGYSFGGKDDHLSKGDAVFVDVLHSNPGTFGFPEAIGDVDFYPNPGSWKQPGCWLTQLTKNRELRYLVNRGVPVIVRGGMILPPALIFATIDALTSSRMLKDKELPDNNDYFTHESKYRTYCGPSPVTPLNNFKVGCSHNRSWRLYAESILNPTGFPATSCKDWTSGIARCQFTIDGYMGYGAQPTMNGKMYLKTNDRPPYARGGP